MANQIIAPEETTEAKQADIEKHANIKAEPPVGPAFKYNKDYHQMADFLGLKSEDKMDEDVANKISFLREFTDEKEELDAMVKIRNIIRMLGLSTKGKELVNTLYQYGRLKQEQDRIDKEMSLITP